MRFVVPVDVATPSSSRLADLGATDLDGRLLRLLEGQDIAPAEVLNLTVSGLPGRSVFDVAREFAGEWYVRYAIPAAVGVTVAVLLMLSLRRRGAVTSGVGREQLLAEARALRDAYDRHAIGTSAFEARSRAIRAALVQADVRERLNEAGDEGHHRD